MIDLCRKHKLKVIFGTPVGTDRSAQWTTVASDEHDEAMLENGKTICLHTFVEQLDPITADPIGGPARWQRNPNPRVRRFHFLAQNKIRLNG